MSGGYEFAPCDRCGEEAIIRRGSSPACRMTPGCPGRHRPPIPEQLRRPEVDGIHVAATPATVTEAAVKNRLVEVHQGDVDEARSTWLTRPAHLRPDGEAFAGVDPSGKGLLLLDAVERWIDGLADDDQGDLEDAEGDDGDVVDAELVEPDELPDRPEFDVDGDGNQEPAS